MDRTANPSSLAPAPARSTRMRAGWLSLAVGSLVLAGKFAAFSITGSTAMLSDALESVINIAAATLLLISLYVASRPADSSHPYGHGKIEFLSAGIEGALVAVAGLWIAIESARAFALGPQLHNLEAGLSLLAAVSVVNAALGLHLVRVGRRTHSAALVADGKHVLADAWMSAGVIAGLGAVRLTGWSVLDPVIALGVAVYIFREGWLLVRGAFRGLMDAADPALLKRLTGALEERREDEWIRVHGLRAWHSGAFSHVDLHLVVPRYLDAEQLHGVHDAVERALVAATQLPGEVVVHFDPCRPHMCSQCTVPACPVRAAAFAGRDGLTVEEVIQTDATAEFWNRNEPAGWASDAAAQSKATPRAD